MTKSKIKVPVYARKAIETGDVWQTPPCVNNKWDDAKTCPACENQCPHAEITRGSIKSSYWAKCNAKENTLKAISLYKEYFDSYTR